MSITPTDIANLEAALISGELTVKISDRQITYRSVDEIERALAYARRRQSGHAPSGGRHQLADFTSE